MLNEKEYLENLKFISDKYPDDEEIFEKLEILRDDFYNRPIEVYDKSDIYAESGEKWRDKFEDIREKYRERFFSTSSDEIKENQKEDIAFDNHSTEMSFDDLFEAHKA